MALFYGEPLGCRVGLGSLSNVPLCLDSVRLSLAESSSFTGHFHPREDDEHTAESKSSAECS